MADFGDLNFDINFEQNIGDDTKIASRFYCAHAGTVNYINCYSVSNNHTSHVQAAIYTDVAGAPGALLGVSSVITPYDNVYHNFACAIVLPAAGYYWISLLNDNSTWAFGNQFCKVTGAPNIVRDANVFGAGFSNPFGTPSTGVNQLSIFANFTPALTAGAYLGDIIGGIGDDGGPNQYQANTTTVFRVTADGPGHISEIIFYLKKGYPGAKVKGVIYDATGVQFPISGFPGTLLAATAELVGPVITENRVTFSPAFRVPAAGDYYIGLITDTQMFDFTRDAVAPPNYQVTTTYASGPAATYPSPYVNYSFYPTLWATFATDGPPPPPVSSTCSSYSGTSSAVRLIPFQFNTQQAYALEFGGGYMRVIMNGGLVLEPALAITGISQSSPALLTVPGNPWVSGDWVYISGVTGMTDINNDFYYVGSSGGTVQLFNLDGAAFDTSSFPAYFSGGTAARVFVLETPYAAADLKLLKFTQSADVMTLTHPNYQPRDLTRTQHYAWTLAPIDFSATIAAPTGIVQTNTVATDLTDQLPLLYQYAVTAVDDLSGTESLPGFSNPAENYPLDQIHGTTNNLKWTGSTGATRYNIYKSTATYLPQSPAAYFGYIGSSKSVTFSDLNFAPDFGVTPPVHSDPFTMGRIINIDVLTEGSDYSFDAVVHAVDPSGTSPSPGSGFVGLVTFGAGPTSPGFGSNPIVSIVILNPGKNYSTGTTLQITSSTGSGATFAITTTPVVDASDTTNPDWPNPNYPGVTTYFQQRKLFAASKAHPDTIWGTQTGNFHDMDVSFPVRDSDALTLALASQEVNAIEFLVTMPSGMVTLTSDGAWQVSGGAPGTALTPVTAQATPQAFNGASNSVPPLRINFDILYVPYQGSNARDLSYNFFTNIYTGTDITVLSSHLFYGKQVVEWTYAEDPNYLIWAIRNDGALLSCTWMKEQEINGWARHDTQGCFQSICSIPEVDDDGTFSQAVYVVVDRRMPGVNSNNPTLYIERFASRKFLTDGEPDPTKPWFVDCGARYDGPPATIISGLGYLEGLEVVGLADGNVVGPLFVANGKVTLPYAASFVTLGLPYTGQLKTLRLDTGEPTVQSKRKKINRGVLRVVDTRGLLWGHEESRLTPFKMRTPAVPYGDPIPLQTGDQLLNLAPLWDAEGQVVIEQPDPLPATVTGIMLWTTIGDSPG